jgi:hypothetical protein
MLVAPLTAAGIDKTEGSNFCSFKKELLAPYSIHVPTYFCDSARELTTSTMKKGDPDTSGSDLNKNNIIKPTLNHLLNKDCKALEAYHKEVDEIFLSHYEVTRQGLI